jgi:hypothetical protein
LQRKEAGLDEVRMDDEAACASGGAEVAEASDAGLDELEGIHQFFIPHGLAE